MIVLQHNLVSMFSNRQLGVTTDNKKKSTEKLSSGYRINRSADDAAGLSISEKMRSQVRGLLRAAENTKDGIGMVQTTDGATDQAAAMLQRMRELAIQALNTAVNTEGDRAKIQQEFDQLQSELDKTNDQTEFNKKDCFIHYATDHYVTEGNRYWAQDQLHTITGQNNSLTIKYKVEPDEVDEDGNVTTPSAERQVTIRIPSGTYTTQQLVDEIDDVTSALGLDPEKFAMEFADDGTVNLVLENGAEITDMDGGLTYLLHDEYIGSDVGSLIGTTVFDPGSDGLQIYAGHNDHMEFTIQYLDGSAPVRKSITIPTIPDDMYTREEMIDFLNSQLDGTNVRAMEYGDNSIMLGSDVAIVTGLRGNMFEIDDPSVPGTIIATSVFYDNTKYGTTQTFPAEFVGGDIINTSDIWHSNITIDDTNNLLRVRVNDKTGNYTDVRLANGSYNYLGIINQLNSAFTSAGVGLTASAKDTSTTVRMTNGQEISLTGFKITTTDSGKDTSIEFDTTTKAYGTLFTDRVYTSEGKEIAQTKSATQTIYKSSLLGAKVFSDSENLPLIIDSTNNTMTLNLRTRPIGSSTYTTQPTYSFSLTQKTYNTLDEIVEELNTQFANKGISDKISAEKTSDNKVKLVPSATNKTVGSNSYYNTITGSGSAYNAIMVGQSTVASQTILWSSNERNPVLSLPNALPDEINGNVTYKFTINGETRSVALTEATYTQDEFIEALNDGLTAKPDTVTAITPYTYNYSPYTKTGTTTNRNVSVNDLVSDEPELTSIYADVKGSGSQKQGTTEQTKMDPATFTLPVALPNSMTLDSSNNDIKIWVNGTKYEVRLTEKTYTSASELADEIQSQLNETIIPNNDKMKVTLNSDNTLTFETLRGGENVGFQFGNESGMSSTVQNASGFLHELTAVKSPASVSTGLALKDNVSIAAGTSLSLYVNGDSKSITWDTDVSFTSASAFLSDLNTRLADIGVTASNASNLTFTTDSRGRGSSITFDSASNPDISKAMFGDMITTTPASMTVYPALKTDDKEILMEDGKNKFQIKVNGNTYDAIFEPGKSYTRDEILAKLNSDFSGVATATLDSSKRLVFTTVAQGNGTTIGLGSNSANSSAAAGMFGQTVAKHPGIVASVQDGKLKLTGTDIETKYQFGMYPVSGSDIYDAGTTTQTQNPTSTDLRNQGIGIYNGTSYNPLANPTVIDSDNNTLKFKTVNYAGTSINRTVTIPVGSYTPEQLVLTLQSALDSSVGSGELTVSTNSFGAVSFSSEPNYNIYSISNWSGSFYTNILKGDVDISSTENVSNTDGSQIVGDTYIVGRKDVRNQTTTISPGVNDTFGLELSIDNTIYNFNFTLDSGSYNSSSLLNMLNSKLQDAASANGLPADIVKADIGKYNTGVVGSDDANAIDFYLNKDVNLEAADYKIEGLTGTSLFDIFYKTVGTLTPAYTSGTKDLGDGVDILPGKQDFSVNVDGTTYTYTIDPTGHYSSDELVDKINELIQAINPTAPIKASLNNGVLRFTHDNVGRHSVTNLKGPAVQSFFYETDAQYGESDDLWLQVGANAGQGITFSRYSVSSHALGVNSVNVTEKKYADKALVRIDEALNLLNSNRSRYGALQNRLEFTYNVDTNSAENLQDAESRIRDTDMAEEMMRLAKENILEQAGISVLSQARQSGQGVLSLLQ